MFKVNVGLIIAFLGVVFSYFWAQIFPFSAEVDYGGYFVGAASLENNYVLYNDLFDHKGPILYLVFYLICNLFSYIYHPVSILFLLSLSFCSAFIYFYHKTIEKKKWFIFSVIVMSLFFNLHPDGSMSLFIATIYLVFISVLLKHGEEEKRLLLLGFLGSLMALTRIDGFLLVFAMFQKKTLKYNLKLLLYFISFFLLILSVSSFVLKFNIFNFYHQNFVFNFEYILNQAHNQFFGGDTDWEDFFYYRVAPLITWLFLILSLSSYKEILNHNKLRQILIISLIHYLLGFGMDDYMNIIGLTGITAIIFKVGLKNNIRKSLLVFFMFFMLGNLFPSLMTYQDDEDLKKEQKEYQQIIDYMSEDPEILLLIDNAWIYRSLNRKPTVNLNHFWFYYQMGFSTDGLLKDHKRILSTPGQKLIMENQIRGTKYRHELMNNSEELLKINKKYSIYMIEMESD
ncbi:MAG: hypothetical protein HON90_15360 [Halobacteriovoraceae bacterium]|jgi:hypothetical protein|nr:hypothetical protein [Halobacteriovoraceae bacterium]